MKYLKRILSFCLVLTVAAGLFAGVTDAADKYELYPITENRLLEGKVVFIDAGHGEGYPNGVDGFLEEEGNFDQAMLVKENLERCGATVFMTRPTREDVNDYARMSQVNKYALQRILEWYENRLKDETISDETRRKSEDAVVELNELIAIMDQVINEPEPYATKYYNTPWSRDREISEELAQIFDIENCNLVRNGILFLSIHSNTSRNTSVNGTTAYHITNDFEGNKNYYTQYSFVSASRRFAENLADEVSSSADFANNGAKPENYFMIREINIPSALVQVAYYTNQSDRDKLRNENYQKRIAAGMTYAVMKHFGVYVDPYSIVPFKAGDINGDGTVDNADVVTLARYLLGAVDDINESVSDVNGDGKVSNSDLVLILRHIVNGTELSA